MLRCCNLRAIGCYDAVRWWKLHCCKLATAPIEHRNILAVHYINKHPVLESVLKALARFRRLAMKSCRKPSLVFKEAPWDAWKKEKKADSQDADVSVMRKITENYQWKSTSYQSTCGNTVFCKLLEHIFLIKKYVPRKSNGKNTEPVKIKPKIIIIQLQLRRTKKNWSVMEIRHG